MKTTPVYALPPEIQSLSLSPSEYRTLQHALARMKRWTKDDEDNAVFLECDKLIKTFEMLESGEKIVKIQI